MKKTLVVGVHDGLVYLPFTLPRLKQLPVDETIFVLDHCENEEAYIKLIKKTMPNAIIIPKHYAKTKYRPNETFTLGFKHATGELIYVTAEDCLLDPIMFQEKYWRSADVGMVDFRYYPYDPFKTNYHVLWDMALLKISDLFGYGTVRSGLFGIRREVYDLTGGFRDVPTEEDWLRKDVKKTGYRHVHIKTTKHLHLRPSYDRKRQIMQGTTRYEQHIAFWRVLAHCCLHLKPLVMLGYLQAWSKQK